ncbi:hypothetical protein TI39_contig5875g00011 [Zymoseptoria brevis]|uniref:Histone chaperone domain-containing protein n=1 Tax=Zymoseptoria brevis TaxID=1047168 RepID=A0A0F4G5G5_9PEZI|nr:hypothetical protein TI39_contig5875g00011 [Zymoseptoria brevis]
MSDNEVPSGSVTNDDYVSRPGQKDTIPVQSDDAGVEDPIDAETADSDATLEKDEQAAMDKSNIIDERTRGAAKQKGAYTEPGDEEGLPGAEDGTSSGAAQ